MNKIVAISVYGERARYIEGARRQYELAKHFYPDWEFRIYTDDAKKFESLKDAHVIEVKDNSHGVFWRFEPLFESEDNIVIVRDSDGRITEREARAVNEWLLSDKKFHVYRDHEAHFQFPIIACAFGYKGKLSEKLHQVMHDFSHRTNYYTNDQVYLRDFIWPEVRPNAMIHTMYEGWFGETRKKLKNPLSFCGNGYDENDMPLYAASLAEMSTFVVKPEHKFDGGVLN